MLALVVLTLCLWFVYEIKLQLKLSDNYMRWMFIVYAAVFTGIYLHLGF